MKKVYILNQTLLDGTVILYSNQTCYHSRKLAEKVRDKLKKKNKTLESLTCTFHINEVTFYENELEIPCLNKE